MTRIAYCWNWGTSLIPNAHVNIFSSFFPLPHNVHPTDMSSSKETCLRVCVTCVIFLFLRFGHTWMGPCTVSCLFPQRDRKPLRWWDSLEMSSPACRKQTQWCLLRVAAHPLVLVCWLRSRQEAAGATYRRWLTDRWSEPGLIFIAFDVARLW